MLELIKYIVGQFAEDKENVSYDVEETEDAINVTVTLSDSLRELGKSVFSSCRSLRKVSLPVSWKGSGKRLQLERAAIPKEARVFR